MPTITISNLSPSDEYVPDYDDTVFAPSIQYMPASSSHQQYNLDRAMARLYMDVELFIDFHSSSGKYRLNPRNDVLPPHVTGGWPFQTIIKPDYREELSVLHEQHRAARRRYEQRLEKLEDLRNNLFMRLAEAERISTVLRCGGIMPRSYHRVSAKAPWAREQFQNRGAAARGILAKFPILKQVIYANRRGEVITHLDECEPSQVNDIVLGIAELCTLNINFAWSHMVKPLVKCLFGTAQCIEQAYYMLHYAPDKTNSVIEKVADMVAEKNPALSMIHKLQASSEKEGMVCYYDNGYKAMKDRKTRTTMGRYLTRFLPDLPQSEVKRLADAYSVATKPANIQFIQNTNPDAWVWAYENGPTSCMTYNRDSRYLRSGLSGEKHPVRAYACPCNDLALAVLMPDGVDALGAAATSPEQSGTDLVLARAIVNIGSNGWVRIYSQSDAHRDQLIAELRKAGFRSDSGCLEGQQLNIVYSDEDGFTCPYLDGDYTMVDMGSKYLTICDDGDYEGSNSTGWVENDSGHRCDHCGDRRVDPDDDAYVDGVGTVCSRCIANNYSYAYVNRYEQEYIPDDQAICVDGEYYLNDTSVLSGHDIEECAVSGNYYHTDEMHVMDLGEYAGSWVHESDAYSLPNDLGYCTNDEADSILAEHGIDENGDPVEDKEAA